MWRSFIIYAQKFLFIFLVEVHIYQSTFSSRCRSNNYFSDIYCYCFQLSITVGANSNSLWNGYATETWLGICKIKSISAMPNTNIFSNLMDLERTKDNGRLQPFCYSPLSHHWCREPFISPSIHMSFFFSR